MPTLSTIFFVGCFGQPLAFMAAFAGLTVSNWIGSGEIEKAFLPAAFGVVFGYMMRASEMPRLTEGK